MDYCTDCGEILFDGDLFENHECKEVDENLSLGDSIDILQLTEVLERMHKVLKDVE